MTNWTAISTERIDDRWRSSNRPFKNSYRNSHRNSYRNRNYYSRNQWSRARDRRRRRDAHRRYDNGRHHIPRAPNTGLHEFINLTENDKNFPIDPTGDVLHKLAALNIHTINDYVCFGIRHDQKGDNWFYILSNSRSS